MRIRTQIPCSIRASDGQMPVVSISPAYSGGFLLLPDFDMIPVVIDLATLSMDEPNIPILWQHNPELVLGHTDSLKNDGRKISASGFLSASEGPAGEKVKEILTSSRLGHRWEASVGSGTIVTQNLEFIEPHKTVQANGQTFTGPLYLTRNIRLCEISIVPVGADRATHITITASGLAEGRKMNFTSWLQSKAIDPATLTQELADQMKAQYLAENPGADVAALDGEIAALLNPAPPVQAGDDQNPAPPVPPVQAGDDQNPAPPVPPVQAGDDQNPPLTPVQAGGLRSAQSYLNGLVKVPRIVASGSGRSGGSPTLQNTLTAAMLLRNGWEGKRIEAAGIPAAAIDAATAPEYRRCGFHRMFRKAIQASGYSYGYDLDPVELVQEGLAVIAHNTRRVASLRAAGLSTDVTQYVFKDTIDKEIMLRYEDQSRPLLDITKLRPTKSFKEVTDFRFGMQGSYVEVPPGGDPPSSKLTDEGWTAKPVKFMRSAKITFEQMTDDDTGVLGDIGEYLAVDASDTQEEMLAVALLNGKGDFAQSASSALAIAGLGKAVKAFRKIKTKEGKTINRNASALLVPSALEAVAQQLYVSATLNETTTTDTPKADANIYQSKYTPIVCPMLDSDSGLANGSDTDWFLLADQKRSPILAAAHLDGYLSPQVKESEISRSYDVEITAMFTFKAKIYDTRGAVRCKSGS